MPDLSPCCGPESLAAARREPYNPGMLKVLVPLGVLRPTRDAFAPFHGMRETYVRKLAKYGLMPLLVSPLLAREGIDELYALADGVFCMGGDDFHPVRYGKEPHERLEPDLEARDELELHVTRRALADRKPYLGICRGCQCLAIAAGGTLHQYLPDITTEDHGALVASYEDLARPAGRHEVRLEPGSLVRDLVGADEVVTNSKHHQAVDEPGTSLRVTGRTPGGIAEVVEHADRSYFCMGIQSHPETEDPSFFEPVFAAYAEAVAQHAQDS